MKKEIAIAIVIGLFLGLIVTFGIYIARTASEPSVEDSANKLASSTPGLFASTAPEANDSALVLSSPEDGDITSNKEIQVSGTTTPNSFVFIFYGTEYKIERADSTGNFSTKVPTKNGTMIITVRAVDLTGKASEETRAVFIGDPSEVTRTVAASASASPAPRTAATRASASARTTAKASPSPTPAASPAGSADQQATENLKQRIDRVLDQRQEKLLELEKSGQVRQLFVGDVQRIIERTVTIKTRRGNQSFTITPDLAILRDNKKATVDDIAVGDWIGMIGFADKETLQPQHIFVYSTSLLPTTYPTILGTTKDITRAQIKVTESDGTEHAYGIVKTTAFQNEFGAVMKRELFLKEKKVLVIPKAEPDLSPALLLISLEPAN